MPEQLPNNYDKEKIMSEKEKSAVYNILAFNFEGEDDASAAVKEIKKSGVLDGQMIVAEAVVSVNEKGKTHIHEPGHGVAGKYLGRPFSKGDLKEIGEAMEPDTSAFLLLVEDINSEVVVDSMEGYNANVVTLTVGDELSGEIAQYVAGEATDVDGNVVVGRAAVAADSSGDVTAAGEVAAGTTKDTSS